jgi:hypothetical protein
LCTDCANAILKTPKPYCPDDGEELRPHFLFKDRCAEREIQALECYCKEKKNGCKWKGTVAELQDHICPLEKVCFNTGIPTLNLVNLFKDLKIGAWVAVILWFILLLGPRRESLFNFIGFQHARVNY